MNANNSVLEHLSNIGAHQYIHSAASNVGEKLADISNAMGSHGTAGTTTAIVAAMKEISLIHQDLQRIDRIVNNYDAVQKDVIEAQAKVGEAVFKVRHAAEINTKDSPIVLKELAEVPSEATLESIMKLLDQSHAGRDPFWNNLLRHLSTLLGFGTRSYHAQGVILDAIKMLQVAVELSNPPVTNDKWVLFTAMVQRLRRVKETSNLFACLDTTHPAALLLHIVKEVKAVPGIEYNASERAVKQYVNSINRAVCLGFYNWAYYYSQ